MRHTPQHAANGAAYTGSLPLVSNERASAVVAVFSFPLRVVLWGPRESPAFFGRSALTRRDLMGRCPRVSGARVKLSLSVTDYINK